MTSTDNLILATTLRYFNFSLISIDKSSPKARFLFEDSQEVKKVIQNYWAGSLLCEPRALLAAQKELKSMLYDPSYKGAV